MKLAAGNKVAADNLRALGEAVPPGAPARSGIRQLAPAAQLGRTRSPWPFVPAPALERARHEDRIPGARDGTGARDGRSRDRKIYCSELRAIELLPLGRLLTETREGGGGKMSADEGEILVDAAGRKRKAEAASSSSNSSSDSGSGECPSRVVAKARGSGRRRTLSSRAAVNEQGPHCRPFCVADLHCEDGQRCPDAGCGVWPSARRALRQTL
jgi:hypothetical protein